LRVTRRGFLKLLAGGASILALSRLISVRGQADVVRPPGAIVEEHFNSVCLRCGVCLQVCPSKAIVLAGLEDGIATANTPKIDPLSGPCEFLVGRCQDSMRCTKECPTGALQPIDRDEVKLGSAELDKDKCIAWLETGDCLVCQEVCPVIDAITVNQDLKPVFHENICVGCGTCVYACPADPKALVLLPRGARRVAWPR